MRIERIELREIRMRLRYPFETSFGVTRERKIVLVKVLDGTYAGYGEVTAGEGPFYGPETYETAWHVLGEFLVPGLLGVELASAAETASHARGIRGHNMAKGGLEAAVWDLEAKARGLPLWKLLGGTLAEIECGVSIGIQPDIDALLRKIESELAAGYRRIKIKIKPGLDIELVRAVREAFPRVPLMADANSAYTLADVDLFRKMDTFGLMMVEQPLDHEDLIDHAELQRQIATPVCLDESIHSAADARKAISIGACRIVNVKLGRVGGHSAARAVHDACLERGIPVWCGGMLESGIGRAHNIALSSLSNFRLPGDVAASHRYWDEDLITPPVEVSPDGWIRQSGAPGIGYAVKDDLIDRLTVRSRVFAV